MNKLKIRSRITLPIGQGPSDSLKNAGKSYL